MDCTDQHILVASAPLQLLLLQLETISAGPAAAAAAGSVPGSSMAQQRLVAVRELSMFNVGRPVSGLALVSAAATDMAQRAMTGRL